MIQIIQSKTFFKKHIEKMQETIFSNSFTENENIDSFFEDINKRTVDSDD